MSLSQQRNSGRKRTARRETAGASERKIRRLAEMTAALREGTQTYFEVTRLTSLKSLCQDRAIARCFALYLAEQAQAQLPVRIIHSSQLLVIEDALPCFTAPDSGYWAYQAARQYTERYNPHHGTGLIRESVPMLEDILRCWMEHSSQAEPAPETTGDPYLEMAYAQLHNIRMWYRMFAAKQPVMLYDIQEQKIYAYPYREFKADMAERFQALLEEQYQQAIASNKMVVFVRDNEQRRLVSYTLDIE